MQLLTIAVAVLLSYLLGSVPTGLWLGLRFRNIDIRQHGSKNIGATNTLRVLGKKMGAIAFVCDIAKGLLPVAAMRWLLPESDAAIFCGLAAIAGHTASVFLKFRGGKGVATSAGVFLGLCPVPVLTALAVFAIVVALTRMVSAGSIAAALALVAIVWIRPYPVAVRVIAAAIAALIIFRHRANIRRILDGTENKL